MTPFDTIAAISTPFGKGGVAVIRLSGTEAIPMAEKLFKPKNGKPLAKHAPRTAIYGDILYPDEATCVIDDGLCTIFPAPHSFTGEDTVELSCHGGILVTRSVLSACLMAGARQALAGEFTRRAYMNGKMKLPEAEALGNLLEAGNDEQLRLARSGMRGHLAEAMDTAYDELMSVLANMEAGMDFPEEDLTEMPREEMQAAIEKTHSKLCTLMDTYRTGHAIAEGIPTVICGRPNVGKSALYNRLVGREAAIVTNIAGTTRDILSETVSLGRVTLRLSDTAGLRETSDVVEQIGVERAKDALEAAELVITLFDGSNPPTQEDIHLLQVMKAHTQSGKSVLFVLTKQDLVKEENIPFFTPEVNQFGFGYMPLSNKTGHGLEEIKAAVESMFIDGNLDTGEAAIVFSARQYAALAGAKEALSRVLQSLSCDVPYDICAHDIREAMICLGELCGRTVSEDVISEIFSKFCIGK